MILSTARRRRRRLARPRTPQIEGHTIREYKGVVTGETKARFTLHISYAH